MRRDIFERIIDSNRNLLVNGDISTGKTSNIIFPIIDRIMISGENFLFLDSKEEYINKYYGLLKSREYNIIIINLQELDRSFGWNPLEYPYQLYKNNERDKAIEYLESISNNIFCENNDKSFWNQSASDLFIGLSLALFEDAREEEINLNSISNIVNSNKLKEYITQKDKNSIIYTCSSGTVLAPTETMGGILTTFKQQLRKIVSKDKLNNLLYKTTFDINSISKEKNAIFIINRDDNKEINVISSILIKQVFQILFDSPTHPKYNFILDNIDTINNIDNLSNMLSAGIARNIKFTICTRSLDDFNKKYGEYIDKLCNIININNKSIEIMLDNKYEKIRYFIGQSVFPKDNINYPIIARNNIEIFNLTEFLNKEKINNLHAQTKKIEINKEEKISINKQNNNETFVNNNPFIKKQDDNIFSVYEDNKMDYNTNNNEIDELINKIDKKLNELVKDGKQINTEENNYQIDNSEKNDYNTEEEQQESDGNFYFEEEQKDYHLENSTEELLRIIDEKIAQLEKETSNNNEELQQESNTKPNNDVFPNIEDNVFPSIEDNNIFPSLENNEHINNDIIKPKRLKNRLNNFNNKEIIEEELEAELEELGFIKIIDGKKYYMNGYLRKKQELLKDKYNFLTEKNNIVF